MSRDGEISRNTIYCILYQILQLLHPISLLKHSHATRHAPDSPTASAAASVGGTVLVFSVALPAQLCVLLPSHPLPPQLPPAQPAERGAVARPEFSDVYQT